MTQSKPCPSCDPGQLREQEVQHRDQVGHDGSTYTLEADVRALVCDHCGAVFIDASADVTLRRILRDRLGLMQPEQIKATREQLGLTQADVHEAIGIAPSTLSRWEQFHAIQSRRSDALLRYYFHEKAREQSARQLDIAFEDSDVTYSSRPSATPEYSRPTAADTDCRPGTNSGYALAA